MHPILFGLKRAFHTSNTFCRRRLYARHGLTPSRFDIVYLLRKHYSRQRDVRRELGIHTTTLARMLKALERLEMLTRTRDASDRRGYNVYLTKKGVAVADAAIEELVSRRAGMRVVHKVFRWPGASTPSVQDFHYIWDFEDSLGAIERWFGPRVAKLHYPSHHPDD